MRPADQDGLEVHASKDLVESLGLDISSSSADESSPIKANKKKRKRPLGFSGSAGQEFVHSVHKRKIVSWWLKYLSGVFLFLHGVL